MITHAHCVVKDKQEHSAKDGVEMREAHDECHVIRTLCFYQDTVSWLAFE